MATLELLIDASGATRGAQQAEAALGRVKTAAEATATTTARVGQSLSSAFQATGGSIQIAQGISQTATALGSLNTAAAAFSASRVLLEISKTADDFRNLSGNVTTVTKDIYGMTTSTQRAVSVWAALGAVMRAHPVLTIASAVGAVASVVSIFGSNAKQAAADFDKLGESIAKAGRLDSAASLVGGTGGRQQAAIAGASFEALANLVGPQSAATLGAQTGSQVDVLRFLANQYGDQQAAEYLRTGYSTQTYAGQRLQGTVQTQSVRTRVAPNPTLTAEQARAFLIARYQASSREAGGSDTSGLYQFGASGAAIGPAAFPFTDNSVGPNDYVSQSADDRMRVEAENAERINENMRRAADYAGQIGDAFGSSLADVLFKTTSLRQVFTSILQQSVRSGLGGIGQSIFSAAVSGLTTNQQGANAGIRKPGES